MNTSLTHFLTTDNLRLPGLLYEPDGKTDAVALFLHGCGSSSIFYKPMMNLWGKQFTENNIAFFPFNNRGAHYVKTLHRIVDGEETDERLYSGTYYEKIKDSIHDIDGAINYLQEKEYKTFYLIGHSTGANKIAVYDYYHRDNPVSKYILLAGGDDTGLYYQELGKKRFNQALKRARKEIKKGDGEKISPKYIFPNPYSYQSVYDVLNPDGDYNIFPFYEYLNNLNISNKELFREIKQIQKPTRMVYGEHDEFCYDDSEKCVDALKKQTHGLDNFSYRLIPDTNHGFDGKEDELGEEIITFLLQ